MVDLDRLQEVGSRFSSRRSSAYILRQTARAIVMGQKSVGTGDWPYASREARSRDFTPYPLPHRADLDAQLFKKENTIIGDLERSKLVDDENVHTLPSRDILQQLSLWGNPNSKLPKWMTPKQYLFFKGWLTLKERRERGVEMHYMQGDMNGACNYFIAALNDLCMNVARNTVTKASKSLKTVVRQIDHTNCRNMSFTHQVFSVMPLFNPDSDSSYKGTFLLFFCRYNIAEPQNGQVATIMSYPAMNFVKSLLAHSTGMAKMPGYIMAFQNSKAKVNDYANILEFNGRYNKKLKKQRDNLEDEMNRWDGGCRSNMKNAIQLMINEEWCSSRLGILIQNSLCGTWGSLQGLSKDLRIWEGKGIMVDGSIGLNQLNKNLKMPSNGKSGKLSVDDNPKGSADDESKRMNDRFEEYRKRQSKHNPVIEYQYGGYRKK